MSQGYNKYSPVYSKHTQKSSKARGFEAAALKRGVQSPHTAPFSCPFEYRKERDFFSEKKDLFSAFPKVEDATTCVCALPPQEVQKILLVIFPPSDLK